MQRPLPVLVILGALGMVGCAGKTGEMRLAEPHEGEAKAVVDFQVEYATKPPKEARDTGNDKFMKDPRMKQMGDMPFDGKRMIFGGFEVLLDT